MESWLALRPMMYLVTALLVAMVVTVFAEPTLAHATSQVLDVTAFACIGIFLWNVQSAASGVLRLVFVFLAVHTVVGYLVAQSSVPWMVSGTLDDRSFSLSFVVVASGLMVASYGFCLAVPSKGWLPTVDARKLVKLAKWMTVAATVGLVLCYRKNQMLPWQIDIFTMDMLRYRITGLDEWLINRSTDVLMITVPLLFLFDRFEKAFALLGVLGLAITFKRAPILDVIFVVTLASVIRTGKLRKLIVTTCAVVGVYAASQFFFHGLFRNEVGVQDVYSAVASGLPEVRDLGWVLWLNGHELHWGSTLVQAVLPVPSVISPKIQEHSLRGLTTRLIRFDWDELGGLRLTLAGEGYLNFGVVGAMLLCALWGWGVRKLTGVLDSARQAGTTVATYFAATLVSWMAFWLYLGGSQASGVVRSSLLILAMMYFFCRVRTQHPVGQSERPHE